MASNTSLERAFNYLWPTNDYLTGHKLTLTQKAVENHPLLREHPEDLGSVTMMPDASLDQNMVPQGMVLRMGGNASMRSVMGHIPDLFGILASCRITIPHKEQGNPDAAAQYNETMECVVSKFFKPYGSPNACHTPDDNGSGTATTTWLMDYSMHKSRSFLPDDVDLPLYASLGRHGAQIMLTRRRTAEDNPEYLLVVKNYCQKLANRIHKHIRERDEKEYTVDSFATEDLARYTRVALLKQQAFISWLLIDLFKIGMYVESNIPQSGTLADLFSYRERTKHGEGLRDQIPAALRLPSALVVLTSWTLYNVLVKESGPPRGSRQLYRFYDRCQCRLHVHSGSDTPQQDIMLLGWGDGCMTFYDHQSKTQNGFGQTVKSRRNSPNDKTYGAFPLSTPEVTPRETRVPIRLIRKRRADWFNNAPTHMSRLYFGGQYLHVDPASTDPNHENSNGRMNWTYATLKAVMRSFFAEDSSVEAVRYSLVASYHSSGDMVVLDPFSLAMDVLELTQEAGQRMANKQITAAAATTSVQGGAPLSEPNNSPDDNISECVRRIRPELRALGEERGLPYNIAYSNDQGRYLFDAILRRFNSHDDNTFGHVRLSNVIDLVQNPEYPSKNHYLMTHETIYDAMQDNYPWLIEYYAGKAPVPTDSYADTRRAMLLVQEPVG